MQTVEKITNLLLSQEQANKDLAFALMEGQGVGFDELHQCIAREVFNRVSLAISKPVSFGDTLFKRVSVKIVVISTALEVDGVKYKSGECAFHFKVTTNLPFFGRVLANMMYSSDLRGIYRAVDKFTQEAIIELKLKYNETRQSNHHNQ